MLNDLRPVRRVQRRPDAAHDEDRWPFRLPPVAQLLETGLELPAGVTFLVGENGSGKSTLVEGIAAAAGLNAEGGSRHARHSSRVTESPLHEVLQLVRSVGAPRAAFFLRAETMHGLYTYLDDLPPGRDPQPSLHHLSHGESFLEVLTRYFARPGFYVLDEPESALSFSSCLALVGVLAQVARDGGQVRCATHAPLLTAMPGATLLQVDEDGFSRTTWEDLPLVDHWRRYLHDPGIYLRHVLG